MLPCLVLNIVGQLEPSENWDHLFGELGPPCFSLKWSYLPDKVVPIARMAKICRTIGTTLSENWNHLVGQLEPPCLTNETTGWCNLLMSGDKSQESRVKSQESSVKSKESRVKSKIKESRVKSQESRVKSQESRVKSQESREKSQK